ncbi:MAG: hypothetical protein ABJG88_11370 [Litorimonas sp.]
MTNTDTHIVAKAIYQNLCNQMGISVDGQYDGYGRLALISSTHSGSGTSFISRQIALEAAAQFAPLGKRVLLLDYDLYKQSQLQAIMNMGTINGPYDASFGVTPFWQVRTGITEDSYELSPEAYNSLYIQDQTGLAVSVFRWDLLGTSQAVNVIPAPDYWMKLRSNFAMVIVDGPASDRTNMSAALYPQVDTTAIVSLNQNASSPQTLQMVKDIERFGGRFSGLIVNNIVNGAT